MGTTKSRTPLRALTRWQVRGVCLVMFIEGLSSSSINVQVAAVRADLAPSPAGLQLVASAFLVAYAALLLPAGRLADWLDRRKVFLVGLGLFGLGSLMGVLAPSVWVLVAARLLQGAGAALTAPAALGLITAPLPEGPERNRLVALYGALGAVGFSTGLVLPGFLVAHLGWRSSFAVLLPFVLLILALTWRVPANPARDLDQTTQPPDGWGTLALLFLIGGGTWWLGSIRQLSGTALVIGLVVLACLAGVVLARRHLTLPAGALVQPVRRSMIAIGSAQAGMLAAIYVLTLALQDWHDLDAFTVGLLILPQPVCFALLAGVGSAWVTRSGSIPPLLTGMGLISGATAALALPGSARPPVLLVLVSMAAVGSGLALLFPAASVSAINATPERLRSSTGAALTTAHNVGGTGGIALITALALVPRADAPGSLVLPMVVSALMVAAGLGTVVLGLRGRAQALRRPAAQAVDS